ncbi:MAG: transcriptional regulator [Euryarchaeota archaeon TMED141]|nr:MAG: transcriptional regulator [Euryarchaeota archaeon TMED141]RPG76793.1 MAG: transcriptional regulator [Euryarchaeota archaeon TMED141]DAC17129.1 MAG TPA: transcriptional regulator [Candidatus Poseidoniales archaeon]|tara:strand:- start:1342 stop:1770 length:429 start_codon:yes stop_codon:yes gene_type:complete
MRQKARAVFMEVELVQVTWLKPHEHIRPERVEQLRMKIQQNGYLHKPLLVDRVSGTILDGHHRYTAGQALGLSLLPALLFDYLDEERIRVDTWPGCGRESITKKEIIDLAIRGERTPPKTSRHHIDVPIPRIRVPLDTLREA